MNMKKFWNWAVWLSIDIAFCAVCWMIFGWATAIVAISIIGVVLALAPFKWYLLGIVVQSLARADVFFTTAEQECIKFVMKGAVCVYILAWCSGKHVDQNTGQLVPGELPKSWWNRMYGVEFYGWYPINDILEWGFEWMKYVKGTIVSKKARVRALKRFFPYAMKFKKVEDKNGIPLDIEIEVQTEIVNPKQAVFGVGTHGQWIEVEESMVLARLTSYIGQKTLEEITQMKAEGSVSEFVKYMLNINESVAGGNPGLIEQIGAQTNRFSLLLVDPPEELRAVTQAAYLASQKLEIAKKEAEGIERTGQANATAKLAMLEAEATGAFALLSKKAKAFKEMKEAGGEKMYVAEQAGRIRALSVGGGGLGMIAEINLDDDKSPNNNGSGGASPEKGRQFSKK